MIQRGRLKFGDIAWVDFDPSIGHEFRKKRPAIIIQSNEQILASNLITIIPITSNISNRHSDDIKIFSDNRNNLFKDSIIKVHCITSFDYRRFEKKTGEIDKLTSISIKRYLKKHFDL